MKEAIVIKDLSKQYRLGTVSTGTLSHDLNRWWHKVRGKSDPYLKVGETNKRDLQSNYDYVWALKDINFEVREGEVLGIIGANGAGKSTLLKILSKVTGPTQGNIKYKGRIGSLLEVGTGFHKELTGRENIFLNGAILGMTKIEIRAKFDEIVNFSGCEKYIDTPVKRYSSGMMVRLGFAVAAHLEPEILVVDEVLAVGDAEFQKKAIGKMQDISQNDGRTILFVSHNMGAVRNLCTRGIVLENGVNNFNGSTNEAVDYYISKNVINSSVTNLVSQHVKGLTLDVEILSLKMQAGKTQLSSNEDINLIYKVKGNKNVEGFRINATVFSMDDIAIGSFFGDDLFNINNGEEKEILVKISNHTLALGDYKISSSIGKGNFIDGMIDYDIILDAVYFNINMLDAEESVGFTIWNRNWGNILFNANCMEVG